MKKKQLSARNNLKIAALQAELAEAKDTLLAIQEGQVDALVVRGKEGDQIFTLKSADQPYRILVESMNEGALTLSQEGIILYCNHWFAQFIGEELQKVIGSSIYNFLPASVHGAFLELFATGKSSQQRGMFSLQSRSGRILSCIISLSPFQIDGGAGICAVVTDLTEQNRLARSQLDLEQMRIKNDEGKAALFARDEFLSIASHELKTPITSIKIQLQMAKRSIKSAVNRASAPEKLIKMIDTSMKQIDRLTILVEDLLDVSKIRAGHLTLDRQRLNLSELVEELTERHREELQRAGCPVELRLDDTAFGSWDRMRLEQVFINLLTNAIKYAPGKPLIISVIQKQNRTILSIKDFGEGIPKNRQTKIFDRFERAISSRNISGLGLGLFIVRSIVEAHGGTISVESEAEKGSLFIVELPNALRKERKVKIRSFNNEVAYEQN